jgi:hypothetical protein
MGIEYKINFLYLNIMETSLCPYKYIFGEPKKGIHEYRIFDIAIIDFLLTILFSYLISQYFNKNFYEVTIALLLLGIIMHRLFCVRTTIDKILFYE